MGSRLVPVKVPVKEGAGTLTTMYDPTTGARVNLRAPRGFDANATLFQWLDDDRVALMDWEHERHRMLVPGLH